MLTNHFNKLGFKNVWNVKHFRNLIVFLWSKNYVFNVQSNLYNLIFLSQTYHSKKHFEFVMKKVYMFMIYPYSLSTYYGVDHSELNVKIGLAWLIYIGQVSLNFTHNLFTFSQNFTFSFNSVVHDPVL